MVVKTSTGYICTCYKGEKNPQWKICPFPIDCKLTTEQVDHPSHYGGADNQFEVIKVMEAWLTREEFIGAMKFNIHKYTARARMKNDAEDYAKSAWYNNHLTDYVKRRPE